MSSISDLFGSTGVVDLSVDLMRSGSFGPLAAAALVIFITYLLYNVR